MIHPKYTQGFRNVCSSYTLFSGLPHSCGTSAKTHIHSYSHNSASFWAEWTKPSASVSSQNASDDHKCTSFSRTEAYLIYLPCGDVTDRHMQITWLLTIMCTWIRGYFLNSCTYRHSKIWPYLIRHFPLRRVVQLVPQLDYSHDGGLHFRAV